MKHYKRVFYTVMMILFLVTASGYAAWFMIREYRLYKSEKVYESLAAEAVSTEESAQDSDGSDAKVVDFDRLHTSVSEDIYAWIYIPGTNVDYPVFQHPDDNSYYLEHNVDGSEGYPGCIYTENYNSKDFSDPQTVIYGHNMRDGTMFSDLHKYSDEDFFNENRYIYIYTESEVLVYRIFAAYQTDNRHQLLNYDFSKEGTLTEYLDRVLSLEGENVIVDRDTEYSSESRLLTLSTCVMKERQFQLRYLVQALYTGTADNVGE